MELSWCSASTSDRLFPGSRHDANAIQGQSTHHTEETEPALWNEARRKCVFEGKKPRCQDGQEDTQVACSQYASECGCLEEAMSFELGHALETWSDATTQYWVKVGRKSQCPLSGKFATFRTKLVLGETFMPLGCVILDRWRQRRLESLESFRPMGQHDPQNVPKISHSRTRVVCRQKKCHFHSRWRHTQ